MTYDGAGILSLSPRFYEAIAASSNEAAQVDGLAAIWSIDRERSFPVFRKTVLDERFSDGARATYLYAILGNWRMNADESAMTVREAQAYDEFLRWSERHESGAASRRKLDRVLQRLDPSWHGSERRRRFLERSLQLADSEDRKELVRRWLRENEEPLPEPPPPPATPFRDIIVL